MDIFREAQGEPLALPVIATRAMEKMDLPASAQRAVISRIRMNLLYLRRTSRVVKTGEKAAARWTLAVNEIAAN